MGNIIDLFYERFHQSCEKSLGLMFKLRWIETNIKVLVLLQFFSLFN